MAYDENKWVHDLNYAGQDVSDMLELFRWLRQSSYRLIQTISESA